MLRSALFLLRRPAARQISLRKPLGHYFVRQKHWDMSEEINKTAHAFDKARFDALLNRRFFYAPAFEIYGGKLYDPMTFLNTELK